MLTVTNASERLLTTPEAVNAELEAGRLKGFKIGGEWRTTEDDLLEFMGHRANVHDGAGVAGAAATGANLPNLDGVTWRPAPPFSFTWPKRAHEPVCPEHHDPAFATTVAYRGRQVPILIGFADRFAAGMDRKRVNVFLGDYPSIVPLVQFVGTNDYDVTGQLASVIKVEDGRHLRPGDEAPEEYRDLHRCIYSELVVGPNAARSMAVLAHRDDLTLMAKHGLIRAKWKGLI